MSAGSERSFPSKRRRSSSVTWNGEPLTHNLLPDIWKAATDQRKFSRSRVNQARGTRLQTSIIKLAPTWVNRHPEAANWVVKVLPERRTLERDLIASVAAVEPFYRRTAIGFLDRDKDAAVECQNYMETWRKQNVPYQTSAEKCTEDGEHGGVVIPTSCDMDGCPDFYDRLDQMAYDALDDEQRAEYILDEDDPRGRYAKKDADGNKRPNPEYDRDKSGKRPEKPEDRDDAKSEEAHKEAVRRYLLSQEQGGVTIRVIPANDCAPYLTRGTKRDRWRPVALIERTLYYPEDLITSGYGWRGMGDRLLIPHGFDATRTTGQNGMFYLYTLYLTWTDPEDRRKGRRPIERTIIAYSVGGEVTWHDPIPEGKDEPESGVAVIDLYEKYGLEGRFFWYGGGLHTSDDDSDFYWEPYLWPLIPTIRGIEGMQTMANAATAVNATTGYWHKPDHNLIGTESSVDDESLVDASGALIIPEIPESGEIKTVVGEVFPAQQATVSPDLWRVISVELDSLRANTALEMAGAGAQKSGHAMVVKETIAQTAKRHIREGSQDFVKFCGEAAMKIFTAIEREYGVRWPLQRTKEMPVGSELREADDVLEWNSEWIGQGEYRLGCEYPEERNPVREEIAMGKIERGLGSFEELCEASGITDVESEWARVLKTKLRLSPAYQEMMMTRLAKRQGNKIMLQVMKLQQQQRMTQGGMPGFPMGMPVAALNGPGEGGGGVAGGPNAAQASLGGQKAAMFGPEMNDAAAVAALPGGGAAA